MQPFAASISSVKSGVQFSSYELSILDISDTISSSLVRQEFVNTDGAKITNFGNKPREIKFRAFFFGDKQTSTTLISSTYVNHYDFVNDMTDSSLTHVLVHPKYGRIEGEVESLNIIHDDTQDYVAIDVNFVQKDIQTKGFISDTEAIEKVMTMQQIALLNAEIAQANADIQSLGCGGALGTVLDATKTVASQLNRVSQVTRDFCKEVDSFTGTLDSYLSDIVTPINSIDASVNYIGDVPSRIIGSINGVCNRIVGSLSNLSNLPAQLVNNMAMQTRALASTITGKNASFFKTRFYNVTAGSISAQSGFQLQKDNDRSEVARQQELTSTFDSKGNRVATVTIEPTMTIQDLESLLYVARDYVQVAILNDRSNQQLPVMTKSLVSFVNNIKLQKRRQVTTTVNSIPLHLLCMQFGLPYNMAERVYKLNPQIKNPTFCEGAIRIYSNV